MRKKQIRNSYKQQQEKDQQKEKREKSTGFKENHI